MIMLKTTNLLRSRKWFFFNVLKNLHNSKVFSHSYRDASQNVAETKAKIKDATKFNSNYNFGEMDDSLTSISIEECEEEKGTTEIKFPFEITSNDELVEKIRNSVSIQEIFTCINSCSHKMTGEHITLSVFMLSELQKIYFNIHGFNYPAKSKHLQFLPSTVQEFVVQLHKNDSFELLLTLLEKNSKHMNVACLSSCVLYLNKLGLSVTHKTMQCLIGDFKVKVQDDFHVPSVSKFALALFMETNIYSYNEVKEVIPNLYASIDGCRSAEELEALTVALNVLHYIVPNWVLLAYKRKVNELIDMGVVNSIHYRTMLKILLFLNYPQRRLQNFPLMKKCMLLLEGALDNMSARELVILYEIFRKTQEPAVILNEMQRCAGKHLRKMEEEASVHYDLQIHLMCCLVCFSSSKRMQLDPFLERFVYLDLPFSALRELYQLLLITKSADLRICQRFWDQILTLLDKTDLCDEHFYAFHYYTNFYRKVNNFRYERVEAKLSSIVEREIQGGFNVLLPSRCAAMASFVFAFSRNQHHLDYFLYKISENVAQFDFIDYFCMTKGLEIAAHTNRQAFVKSLLEDIGEQVRYNADVKLENCNMMLNFYGHSYGYDRMIDDKIVESLGDELSVCSKSLQNLVSAFHKTDVFDPKMLERLCEYVQFSEHSVLGFNVEKLISLCYYFGYHPKNRKFFETAVNVLLRDERRLSALAYIQATLALCYFQKLPETIIKQIFNVEFLENIDNELANCYYKDSYPFRVRHNLMQLNRAVCLDYPENNIPWFHKSFINDLKKQEYHSTELNSYVKKILLPLLDNESLLKENEFSPYGYHIDFMISTKNQRIAILILNPSAYSKHHVQLKGEYQLKIRHLEILGYKLICVNAQSWCRLKNVEKIKYFQDILQ